MSEFKYKKSKYWSFYLYFRVKINQYTLFKNIMRVTQIQLASVFIGFTLLVFLSCSMDTLPKKLQIKTSPKLTPTKEAQNISICPADCISCQNRTGSCQTCYGPWFQLDSSQCVIPNQLYKLQSTEQEKRFQNFLPSSEWFFNSTPVQNTIKCNPDPLTLNVSFNLLGPFATGNLTYQRTISQHNYFTLKLLLVLTDWNTSQTSLTITIYNQGRVLLSNQTLTINSPQIKDSYRQKICSPDKLDRRVSLILEIVQTQTSQIFIQFTGIMGGSAKWGLSSFILVTGLCNSKCQSCLKYSPKIQNCDICRYFLAHSPTGQKCSTCLSGFYFKDQKCYKCPIEFKQCKSGQNNAVIGLKCEYQSLTNLTNNCTFNSTFFEKDQLNDFTFFGSLYTIDNGGAYVFRCGEYSVVGPVKFGGQISRVFLTLPPHIEISLNFNLFTFNQKNIVERFLIKILIDDEQFPLLPIEEVLNITGTSSQCSMNDKSMTSIGYNGFRTFQTEKFLRHRKTENVKVTISIDTSSDVDGWGLRDMRLVFKRCGENCQICTDQGCQACKGFFQLKQYECATCMINTGKNSNNECVPCNQNCMSCNITKGNKTQCTQCMTGYYLYTFNNVTTCSKNPNFGAPLTKRISQGQTCPYTISSQPNQRLTFDVVSNNATSNFDLGASGKSARKNIQFYLMKMGNWEGDYLNIYANNLLLKQLQFANEGGPLCSPQTNDSMTYHEFDIQDDSNKVQLQFESVRNDPNNNRKFAIAKLLVYPQGCLECSNYNFIYKTKYNYDERLFIEMAFNLVYQNKDPNQFKNIFRIKAGDKQYKYDITANDSIRYWLRSEVINQTEILNKNVSVDCLYPLRVTTKIPTNGTGGEPIAEANKVEFFERLLQTANSFQNTKTLDNSLATVFVDRYSPLKQETSGVLGSQTFFTILTRIVIYLGLASFFFGCQTPCTHVMHNFQKLWVHIYVASLALSPVLKTALWGFRQSQDQNIAINPTQWQSGLPKFLYYDAPAQYQHYYKDITFFRNIYNVGVAFAILILVYIVFNCIFRRAKTNLASSNIFFRHMKNTFVKRPLFYFNSIVFYQYFTVVLACCLQFLDLKTRTNQSPFGGINAAACIIAFIFATVYPIIIHIVLNIKRGPLVDLKNRIINNNRNKVYESHAIDVIDMQDQHVVYNNKYSQIFYRFLQKQLWNDKLAQSEMISQRNFFYNIFRFGDLWWHAIVVILLHNSPFAQAFLLVLTNGFHLALNTFSRLNTTKYFRILKSLQLLFFMVIEIMIIVMASLFSTLNYDSYKALGIVALIFVYLIVAVTFVRFFYTLYRLYRQYMHNYETDPRGVIRQERAFDRGWIKENKFN